VCRRLADLYAAAGRDAERLGVLERLASVEADPNDRRDTLGDAARLAEAAGDSDRALALWQQRLAIDPRDVVALDARAALLERGARWAELIDALEQRAGVAAPGSPQRRADLIRIASVQEYELKDLDAAIAAWQRIAGGSVEDPDAVAALADLYAATERWAEMARLLEASSSSDINRTITRLVRLGDAYRDYLGEPARALKVYADALAISPSDPRARDGAAALLDVPATRSGATDVLAEALRRTDDWDAVLELLPTRIADATDSKVRLGLLRESAAIRVEQRGDHAGALADLAQAFPLAPRDALLESQLQSLATKTGDAATLALAYADAIAALSSHPREAARLQVLLADLQHGPLGDAPGALRLYLQAAAAEPGDQRAATAAMQLAATAGAWDDAAGVMLRYVADRERIDDAMLDGLEKIARDHAGGDARDQLAAALTAQLAQIELTATTAALLHARVASLHAPSSPLAAAALRRALTLGGERPSWLQRLVEAERGRGASPELLDALVRLADADSRDLDILVEAADMASTLGRREQAVAALTQVYARASAALRGTTTVNASRPVDAVAQWATDGLVELHLQAGAARAALDVLIEASRLPVDPAIRRALRLRAADVAARNVDDADAAIDILRAALVASPGDVEIMDRLARLLEAGDRVPELLGLRQAQLALATAPADRLRLRLDVASLVAKVEERGGRLEALRANLAEEPGHEASIDALADLYASKGQHAALSELFEQQAQVLEARGDQAQAARLWTRMAAVAEDHTQEPERAIAAHRRVVALEPNPASLRALARLNTERGQPALAVPWLESLLAITTGGDRVEVLRQLSDAHLANHQPERAIAALESGLGDKEAAIELRVTLADLLRTQQRWEPLARHLTRSLGLIRDDKLASAFARESATIYTDKLGTPEKAITALQTALALDPSAKELRASLATGLRIAGRLDEATALLTELIGEFGRRRAPERAPLHMELGRIRKAEGALEEAMTEVEQATKMDVANAAYQKELAELARSAGQLDRAERTYRALLLLVRRQPPGADEAAVGEAEVLFELHQLAAERGEDEQAKELLESAVDAAIKSDAEVRRLRRSVLAHGSAPTMIRVFELRLAQVTEPLSQAMLYADLAEVLEGPLGKPAEALAAMLRGIAAAPDRLPLHERARALAGRTKQTRAYVDAVEAVVDRLRRKNDPPLVADLLMRAGDALERDADDLAGAAALYRRVETMGERLTEAYYAQARVAGALGDTEEQTRALDMMMQQTQGQSLEPGPDQLDAFYRLAELFMATPNRRAQGVDLLERAFAAEPRWAQAGRILRTGTDGIGSGDARVMAIYERVARASGDSELLLDFLHKQALSPTATMAQVREAVDLATAQQDHARAETLLRRTVAAARDGGAGLGESAWAALALCEVRLAQGDVAGAKDLIDELAAVADAEQVDALAKRAAGAAMARPDQPQLAAELLEFLRERRPTDRTVWEPLLGLYRQLGDGDRLSSVVTSTLPSLTDPTERNAIRLEHARFLLAPLRRPHDAIDVLKDALLDDPDNLEAAALLEQTLIDLGDDEGMAEFLWNRFEDARQRGNRATTLDVAMRLGALLDRGGSPDAERVYREALEVVPDDRELLRQVIAHRDADADAAETARLLERLLAVESPDAAPALAAQLATAYEQAGDDAGVQRTLELAHKAAPLDGDLHARLEGWYESRQMWAELAQMKTDDAAHLAGDAAVARLREAAAIYAGTLDQPLRAAIVLRLAREHAPASPTLAVELAAALAQGGELAQAAQAVAEALDDVQGAPRAGLLLLRAQLRQQQGASDDALADLREAYALDPAAAAPALVDGLDQQRVAAAQGGDDAGERAAMLELAGLATRHGELERGRDLLVSWIERFPEDAAPLSQLCDVDASIEHWDGVIAAATRLAFITSGEAQLAAAERATDAATRAGKPAEAIPVLEHVHAAQPGLDHVRARLREFYELGGAHRELAGILLADAEHGQDPLDRFANYKRAAELLLYQVGDAAAAAVPAERALELSPDDFPVTMLTVDVMLGTGQVEQAGRVLEASIAAQKKAHARARGAAAAHGPHRRVDRRSRRPARLAQEGLRRRPQERRDRLRAGAGRDRGWRLRAGAQAAAGHLADGEPAADDPADGALVGGPHRGRARQPRQGRAVGQEGPARRPELRRRAAVPARARLSCVARLAAPVPHALRSGRAHRHHPTPRRGLRRRREHALARRRSSPAPARRAGRKRRRQPACGRCGAGRRHPAAADALRGRAAGVDDPDPGHQRGLPRHVWAQHVHRLLGAARPRRRRPPRSGRHQRRRRAGAARPARHAALAPVPQLRRRLRHRGPGLDDASGWLSRGVLRARGRTRHGRAAGMGHARSRRRRPARPRVRVTRRGRAPRRGRRLRLAPLRQRRHGLRDQPARVAGAPAARAAGVHALGVARAGRGALGRARLRRRRPARPALADPSRTHADSARLRRRPALARLPQHRRRLHGRAADLGAAQRARHQRLQRPRELRQQRLLGHAGSRRRRPPRPGLDRAPDHRQLRPARAARDAALAGLPQHRRRVRQRARGLAHAGRGPGDRLLHHRVRVGRHRRVEHPRPRRRRPARPGVDRPRHGRQRGAARARRGRPALARLPQHRRRVRHRAAGVVDPRRRHGLRVPRRAGRRLRLHRRLAGRRPRRRHQRRPGVHRARRRRTRPARAPGRAALAGLPRHAIAGGATRPSAARSARRRRARRTSARGRRPARRSWRCRDRGGRWRRARRRCPRR
jgi:tetratricopeptide (TPR) repeat protein